MVGLLGNYDYENNRLKRVFSEVKGNRTSPSDEFHRLICSSIRRYCETHGNSNVGVARDGMTASGTGPGVSKAPKVASRELENAADLNGDDQRSAGRTSNQTTTFLGTHTESAIETTPTAPTMAAVEPVVKGSINLREFLAARSSSDAASTRPPTSSANISTLQPSLLPYPRPTALFSHHLSRIPVKSKRGLESPLRSTPKRRKLDSVVKAKSDFNLQRIRRKMRETLRLRIKRLVSAIPSTQTTKTRPNPTSSLETAFTAMSIAQELPPLPRTPSPSTSDSALTMVVH